MFEKSVLQSLTAPFFFYFKNIDLMKEYHMDIFKDQNFIKNSPWTYVRVKMSLNLLSNGCKFVSFKTSGVCFFCTTI